MANKMGFHSKSVDVGIFFCRHPSRVSKSAISGQKH